MAVIVLVMGASGTGKTFSMRTMPKDTTSVINVAGKPFPFRDVNRLSEKTRILSACTDIQTALVSAKARSIIVDDAQYVMSFEFMGRAKEKSYEKFTEIGKGFFDLVRSAASLPQDKIVYFFSHTDTDEHGHECMKTIGKMLQDKICMEGLFTIVLKTVIQDGRNYFATVNNGMDTVKTPFEMFADPLIPNDLKFVDDSIREFYGIQIQPPAPAEPKKEKQYASSLV